jgi:hypothetical protein
VRAADRTGRLPAFPARSVHCAAGVRHAAPSVTHRLRTHGPDGRLTRSIKCTRPLLSFGATKTGLRMPSALHVSGPIVHTTLTVRGSAPTQHAIGNLREPTRNNGQTADLQISECTGPSKIRTSAMTCGYYRTSSPVMALPMIMRWISDVPSEIVKLVEVRAVSAGRWPILARLVSTNSAPRIRRARASICGLVRACVRGLFSGCRAGLPRVASSERSSRSSASWVR